MKKASKNDKKKKINSLIGIVLIIILFISISYIAQKNLSFFKEIIRDDFLGMGFYILILIFTIIIAPVNDIIFLPVAIALWGWVAAALLSLIGWTIGSAIAFLLARKWGVPLIKKFVPLNKIHRYEKFVPKENLFLGVILLRIVIPIDVISYAIGLFSRISFTHYVLATIIGFLPLAFFLAYIGTFPIYVQLIGFVLIAFIFLIGFLSVRHRKKKIK